MVASLSRLSGRNFIPANSDSNVASGAAKSKAGSIANSAAFNPQLQALSSSNGVVVVGAPVLTAPTAPLDAPKVKNRLANLPADISSLVASCASLVALGVEAATGHKNESPEAVAALLSKNFANTIVQLANDVINVASDSVPDGSAAGAGLDIFSDELNGSFGDSLVSIISGVLEMPKRFQDKSVTNISENIINPADDTTPMLGETKKSTAKTDVNVANSDLAATSLQQGPSNYVSSMIADINDHSQRDYRSANLRMGRVVA